MKPYLRYLFRLTWRQKKSFFFLIGLTVLDTVARLVQPYLYKIIVDTLTEGIVADQFTSSAIQLLTTAIAIWFSLAVLNNIINAQNHFLVWQMGGVSSQWVHMEGFQKLLKLDYLKHTKKHSSRFAKIVDEADTATWEMTNWWLGRFLPSAFGFIGMLVIAFTISWPMTLISLTVIPPGLAIILSIIKRSEDRQHKVNKLWNEKHEHMSDQVSNIITYKLNQDEPLFMGVQRGFSEKAWVAQGELNKKWRLAEMLNPDAIGRFFVMAVGVYLVKESQITLGTLFMFMGLLNEILVPLHLLGDILPQYSRRARHIDRVLKLLDEKDAVLDPEHPKKITDVKGKIEFQNVSFRYQQESEQDFQVQDLSFIIEPGQHIAMVGHSGAGKSTIMALLTRLTDPTDGRILLDGIDIRSFRQNEYRHLIGTVLQEHSLYNETIAQNIAYGKHHAARAEIIEAAQKAAANNFIQKLPKGYDTFIGERGVRLSGGEKQRLAIARAILKDPKIVVLDEPTSALDSITEAKVQKGLDTLIKGRSSLVIAHRLATVKHADKIIVMREGKLAAIG
ncbi:MAG TPA: ABC transporter ATP-binding protein, partial [Candidatus Gracilibacteria bacterium]|nr:ABC transporter ATP-binding protein [Candidatus Gracilibacteria bacterium]